MKLLLFDTLGQIHVVPDSAIGRDSQPWFLPDFGLNWRGYEAAAMRVGRLGKGISPKFAERYVDAISTIWVAEADRCPALDFMDGRVVTGKWLPIEPTADLQALLPLLVEASRYATLKTGDIIARVRPDSCHSLTANQRIKNDCLAFNIK